MDKKRSAKTKSARSSFVQIKETTKESPAETTKLNSEAAGLALPTIEQAPGKQIGRITDLHSLKNSNILALQHTIGNQAVQRLLTQKKTQHQNPAPIQRVPGISSLKNIFKGNKSNAVTTPATPVVTLSQASQQDIDTESTAATDEAFNNVVYPYVWEAAATFVTGKVKGSKKIDEIKNRKTAIQNQSKGDATRMVGAQKTSLISDLGQTRTDLASNAGQTDDEKKQIKSDKHALVTKTYQLKQLENKKTEGKLAQNLGSSALGLGAMEAVKAELTGTVLQGQPSTTTAKTEILTRAKTVAGAKAQEIISGDTALSSQPSPVTVPNLTNQIKPLVIKAAATHAVAYREGIAKEAIKNYQGKANKTKRDDFKKLAAEKAVEIIKADAATKATSNLGELKAQVEGNATKLTLEGEGGVHTKFATLGKIIDKIVPKNGDKSGIEVLVKIPVDPYGTGVGFIGLKFTGDIERDGETEIEDGTTSLASSLSIIGGGQLPGGLVSLMGEIGGYIKAASKYGGVGVMDLLSYNLYRRFRESRGIPREVTNYMWGSGGVSAGAAASPDAKKKAKYQEAEDWAGLVESNMGNEDYVESGAQVGFSADIGFGGIAGAKGEAGFSGKVKNGTRYSKETIEKYRKLKDPTTGKQTHGVDTAGTQSKFRPTNRGRQRGVGSNITTIEIEAEASAGIVGGGGSMSLSYVTSLGKAANEVYGGAGGIKDQLSNRLVELQFSISGGVGLPPGTPVIGPMIAGVAIPAAAGLFQSFKSTIGRAIAYFKDKKQEKSESVDTLTKLLDSVEAAKKNADTAAQEATAARNAAQQNQGDQLLAAADVTAQQKSQDAGTAKTTAEGNLKKGYQTDSKKSAAKDNTGKGRSFANGLKSNTAYKNVADYGVMAGGMGYAAASSITSPEVFDASQDAADYADTAGEALNSAGDYAHSLKDAAAGTSFTGLTQLKATLTAGWPSSGGLIPSTSLTFDLDSSTGVEIPGYFEASYSRTSRIVKIMLLPLPSFDEVKKGKFIDLGLKGRKTKN